MRAGISLVVIAFTILAGFFVRPALETWRASQQKIAPPSCFATTSPCTIDDKTIQLSVDTLTPLAPAVIHVSWPSNTQHLQLRLQGLEMDMGEVKILLTAQSPGEFRGELILPVCTLDKMTWHGALSDGNDTVYTGIRMQR